MYYINTSVKEKMTSQENAGVLCFPEYQSVILRQQKFRQEFQKDPPLRKILHAWHDKILAKVNVY